MNGPYFKGQEPAECGHYYPDVFGIGDVRKGNDVVRILDCKYCGRSEIILDSSYVINAINIGKLIPPEEIPNTRKQALERLLKENS